MLSKKRLKELKEAGIMIQQHITDLVTYELKLDEFSHENMGQLNTYLNYYKRNEMVPGDNPPIGILLCTDKNQALVEYSLGDYDNKMFVSKYQLALPTPEEIQEFFSRELKDKSKK